jgi:hypothetical protein
MQKKFPGRSLSQFPLKRGARGICFSGGNQTCGNESTGKGNCERHPSDGEITCRRCRCGRLRFCSPVLGRNYSTVARKAPTVRKAADGGKCDGGPAGRPGSESVHGITLATLDAQNRCQVGPTILFDCPRPGVTRVIHRVLRLFFDMMTSDYYRLSSLDRSHVGAGALDSHMKRNYSGETRERLFCARVRMSPKLCPETSAAVYPSSQTPLITATLLSMSRCLAAD